MVWLVTSTFSCFLLSSSYFWSLCCNLMPFFIVLFISFCSSQISFYLFRVFSFYHVRYAINNPHKIFFWLILLSFLLYFLLSVKCIFQVNISYSANIIHSNSFVFVLLNSSVLLEVTSSCFLSLGLRHTNYERNLRKKQRVIKMLFVVVLEFFICWTPLYVINTIALFWPQLVYGGMGYKTISFCQLLAYTSSCCNPITYCFMNKGFRNSFINLFSFCKRK